MPPDVNRIYFSALNADLIKRCTLRTRGGAGVSQQEDTLWQKMVTAFSGHCITQTNFPVCVPLDIASCCWKGDHERHEVQSAVGALQLCAGQPAGVEAAIHAMREFLAQDDNDGILMIDADNAFNRVNRAVALWNVQYVL